MIVELGSYVYDGEPLFEDGDGEVMPGVSARQWMMACWQHLRHRRQERNDDG